MEGGEDLESKSTATPSSNEPATPSNNEPATPSNAERPSIFEVGGGSQQTPAQKATKRVSTYGRSSSRASRRGSKANSRKKSKSPKSPRSGRGTPRASGRDSTLNIVEDNVTGGISNLMATRRLSSLNDTSAFADNSTVTDH
jgi:hypothetical protein